MPRTLCLMLLGTLCLTAVAEARHPNILLITADNLGYGDLRVLNPASPVITPHLDAFARSGVTLTSFYTASPTCTVSRASLLTGRIPDRHGLTRQLPGIRGNYGPGLNRREVLISQQLRRAGYATGCFGKWNIGFAPGSRPTERGFSAFFGHASGNIDYFTHKYNQKHDLFRGTQEAHVPGYSTDLFADAAIEFIRSHREQPWFVYLPFNAPHFPNPRNKAEGAPCRWQAPVAAFEPYGYSPTTEDPQQRYHAVITALDTAIGRVLDCVDSLDLSDETFVFFYSDNGAFMLKDRGLEVASNRPLRDGGVTLWEGGIRVVAMARWPNRIPAATSTDEPCWSPDLFVTCAKLAETELPADRKLDGHDITPLLCGREGQGQRSFYFTYQNATALRSDKWKIIRTKATAPWQLFDLEDDIGETSDLAAGQPERVRELVRLAHRWQASVTQERQE